MILISLMMTAVSVAMAARRALVHHHRTIARQVSMTDCHFRYDAMTKAIAVSADLMMTLRDQIKYYFTMTARAAHAARAITR